jgi:SagB-type dehydrogenase family enzyme
MLPYEDVASLPLLYHLNSEPWLNRVAYADPTAVPEFAPIAEPSTAVSLPVSRDTTALSRLLAQRQSCRTFLPRPMPLATVALLLDNAYGAIETAMRDSGLLGLTRPIPSAGGLYPLTLRVATKGIASLADGVYQYNVLHHCLEPQPLSAGDVRDHLLAQDFLQDASLVIILSAVFARPLKKYGARGYRYIMLEAGHVAQNICLTATEQGLGSLCVGGFRDRRLNNALGLDERREVVVYCIGVGHPA